MNMIYPLVPTMAAVGVLKGCLAIFVTAGILNTTDGTYVILSAANDGFLYFLPIIIAFSVAKYAGSNPYVGSVIGASLVLPAIVFGNSSRLSDLWQFHIPGYDQRTACWKIRKIS